MSTVEIPYRADSAAYYSRIRHLPYPAWLDSANAGRFDVIVADPRVQLITRGNITRLAIGGQWQDSRGNPFDLVAAEIAKLPAADGSLPFAGGALGFFGYELNAWLEAIAPREEPVDGLPSLSVGIYDWSLVIDHKQQCASLGFLPDCPMSRRRAVAALFARATPAEVPTQGFQINDLRHTIDVETYRSQAGKILHYIAVGDCYQVNLAQRFEADYRGDPLAAYLALRKVSPAPYSAFLEIDGSAVLCHSPEQFLTIRRDQVITRPIKGTRPRADDPDRDGRLAAELLHSAKDRAENLMIVDLLRNDLSKNCLPHSVRVPQLFKLESFANVHHLVSTVTGNVRPGISAIRVLRDCFPGGSITGAPKIRAMEIIRELEPVSRSVYCGSIGYIGADGAMQTNIAIRTLACSDKGKIYCWAGGGIVADSTPEAEFDETLTKVGNLLNALQGGLSSTSTMTFNRTQSAG